MTAILGFITWFWLDTLRARELARAHARRWCSENDLQYLDDTVSLKQIGIGRANSGTLAFARRYRFEFSVDGRSRLDGLVSLIGGRVEWLHAPPLPERDPARVISPP